MTKTEAKPAVASVNALFSKSPDGLREIVRAVMQEMLEAEMTDALGAEKGERTAGRLGYRSGYYTRTLVTRVGKLELRVPQDRDGRFSTELFERYQRSEQALVATLAEMYVQGVSTRKVKAITEELCGHAFSASSISAINKRLDESLETFAERPGDRRRHVVQFLDQICPVPLTGFTVEHGDETVRCAKTQATDAQVSRSWTASIEPSNGSSNSPGFQWARKGDQAGMGEAPRQEPCPHQCRRGGFARRFRRPGREPQREDTAAALVVCGLDDVDPSEPKIPEAGAGPPRSAQHLAQARPGTVALRSNCRLTAVVGIMANGRSGYGGQIRSQSAELGMGIVCPCHSARWESRAIVGFKTEAEAEKWIAAECSAWLSERLTKK